MKEKRVDWIDFCKGVTIILVILGHCITRMGSTGIEGVINLLIYSFHMPLFFFISGINIKLDCSFKEFVLKKIKNILLPGYFFSLLLLIYKIVDSQGVFLNVLSINEVYHILFMTNKSIMGEYWFLPALFTGEILFFLIFKKCRKISDIVYISFFVSLLGLIENKIINIPLPFCIETGSVALSFISIGYLWREKKNIIKAKMDWKTCVVVGILFLCGNAVQYLLNLGKVNFNSLDIRNIITFYLNSFSGICVSTIISKKMNYHVMINYLGRKSLYVFGLHYLFLELCCRLDEIVKRYTNFSGTSLIFTFIITVLCYLCCKGMDRIKR